MRTRTITVIAASVGVAVAAATGVTYASSALESAPTKATSTTKDAAPDTAPRGGNGTGTSAGSNAASDAGSSDSWGGKKGDSRGEGRGGNQDDGRIMINERTYAAEPGSCIVVVNAAATIAGLSANSFNIRNESDKTVEFFNGVTCDNGAPIATVGPHSSSNAITGQQQVGGVIVGSFRVIH